MRTDCQTFTVRREGVGTQLVALELPRYRGGLLQIEQLDTAIEQRCSEMAATGIERQQARRCTGSAQGPRAAGDGKITELDRAAVRRRRQPATLRSEEHTSELQSLMRLSYAVFCLKKNNTTPILLPTLLDRHNNS